MFDLEYIFDSKLMLITRYTFDSKYICGSKYKFDLKYTFDSKYIFDSKFIGIVFDLKFMLEKANFLNKF